MINIMTNIITNLNCEPDGQELLLCTFHILTKKPLLLTNILTNMLTNIMTNMLTNMLTNMFTNMLTNIVRNMLTNVLTNMLANTNYEPDGQELLLCTFHILTKKPLLLLGSDRNLQEMDPAAPIVGWDVVAVVGVVVVVGVIVVVVGVVVVEAPPAAWIRLKFARDGPCILHQLSA